MAYNSSYTGAQHDAYVTKQQLIDLIYPVGSVYISLNRTNPSTLFGGTWDQIKGRFLLGTGKCSANTDDSYFGTIKAAGTWDAPAGSTGGEDWHELTVAEMPAHNHGGIFYLNGDANFPMVAYPGWGGPVSGYRSLRTNDTGYIDAGYDIVPPTNGGSSMHNNMPPYLSVYMWKRTA